MLLKRTILHALKAAAATAAVCAVTGISAVPASAGVYTVPFCNYTSNGSTSTWTHTLTVGGTSFFYDQDRCGFTDGYMYRRFESGVIPAGASDDWTFDAPPGTYISRLDMYQDAISRTDGASNAIFAWQQDGTRSTVAATRPGSTLASAGYDFPQTGSKVIKLRSSLFCQDGANCAGTTPEGAFGTEDYWHCAVVHLFDPTPPTFDSVTGEGWKSAPADGKDRIEWAVRDVGAGVKDVRFFVDGVRFGTWPTGCSAEAIVPCSSVQTAGLTLDMTTLSEGEHVLKLTVADGGSNEYSKTQTITVRRPPQPADGSVGSTPVTTSSPGSTGAATVGDVVQGDHGSWTGSDLTFAYQWMRCDAAGRNCVPIPGATGPNYTATAADADHALQLCVTASNSGGSATRCSTPTAPVKPAPPATNGGSGSTASTADRPGEPTKPAGSTGTTADGGSAQATGADRGQPNGSPAADKVVRSVANSRSASKKVKFGKRVALAGRLLGVDGAPISGAIVSVQVQTAVPGASMADAGQIVTGRDGRFTYLAPAGPSRTVRFGYRSYSADKTFADTTDVKLLVSAGVTMKATPTKVRNRQATVFTGRLLGKPISKRGVVVDLQVFFRKQWRTFAAPRTNKAGRYRFKYRFMAGAATWRFRARVRKETSYPYELGLSVKPVKVKVV